LLHFLFAKLEFLFYIWFMRIACIHFPHFIFQLERRKDPDIDGREVIITTEDRVADCSDEAAAQGVSLDMSVREANYRCPDAILLPFHNHCASVWENILFSLGEFTIKIEAPTWGMVYLDVTRTQAIYPDEHALASAITTRMKESFHLDVRIGVANSRFIAAQAAFCAWDNLVVEPGGERDFLSLVSFEALPLHKEEKAHLRLLGLNTLKKTFQLSKKDLLSQLGEKGAVIFDLVNGQDDTQPIPKRSGSLYLEQEYVSDMPLHTWEALRPAAEEMIRILSGDLIKLRLLSRKITIMLTFQNGQYLEKQLVMKEPSAESAHLALRVSGCMHRLVIDSPVICLRIAIIDPIPVEREQDDLFRKSAQFSERLEGIRDYFSAFYGFAPLMRAEECDSQSRLPERRFRFADA
jgi:nucleotidyltransferase/DNA polymerase involved in DNA repair